ncbi:hypothetical protein ABMA27_005647 [Loxostege sticticalis]|uniref:DNA helicase Pif1-like 2B domain-containing protein n=1 Tax=Loxostege sticticalis TaxID=481309 RepID=A0ABR3HJY0_LOXSC
MQERSCCGAPQRRGAAAVPTRGRPAVGRIIIDNIQDLVNNVYPDIHNISCKTISWFKERAILSPTNEQIDKINNLIVAKIDTPTQIYYSVDTFLDSEEAVHFPTEFLNSLNPSGLPPHKMELKVGCPVILLRNLNPPKLCNGTRLLVKSLKTFIVECTILTGCGTGEDVLIPRIPLIPSDLPFQFKRLKFPVKISFAMTINKSQVPFFLNYDLMMESQENRGQPSKIIGTYTVFSHVS